MDTSVINSSIRKVLAQSMSQQEICESSADIDIRLPSGKIVFTVKKYDFERSFGGDNASAGTVYLLEYDLMEDIELKMKTPWEVISELLELCSLIDSRVDISGIGTLETVGDTTSIPFYVLISSIIEKELLQHFLDIEPSKISVVDRNGNVRDSSLSLVEEAIAGEIEEDKDEGIDVVSFEDFLEFAGSHSDSSLNNSKSLDEELVKEFRASAERFILLKQKLSYLDKNSEGNIELMVQIESVLENIEEIISKFHL